MVLRQAFCIVMSWPSTIPITPHQQRGGSPCDYPCALLDYHSIEDEGRETRLACLGAASASRDVGYESSNKRQGELDQDENSDDFPFYLHYDRMCESIRSAEPYQTSTSDSIALSFSHPCGQRPCSPFPTTTCVQRAYLPPSSHYPSPTERLEEKKAEKPLYPHHHDSDSEDSFDDEIFRLFGSGESMTARTTYTDGETFTTDTMEHFVPPVTPDNGTFAAEIFFASPSSQTLSSGSPFEPHSFQVHSPSLHSMMLCQQQEQRDHKRERTLPFLFDHLSTVEVESETMPCLTTKKTTSLVPRGQPISPPPRLFSCAHGMIPAAMQQYPLSHDIDSSCWLKNSPECQSLSTCLPSVSSDPQTSTVKRLFFDNDLTMDHRPKKQHREQDRDDDTLLKQNHSPLFNNNNQEQALDSSVTIGATSKRLVFRNFQSHVWTDRFKEAKAFRMKYGHCRIPEDFSENVGLGRWAKRQRSQYKFFLRTRKQQQHASASSSKSTMIPYPSVPLKGISCINEHREPERLHQHLIHSSSMVVKGSTGMTIDGTKRRNDGFENCLKVAPPERCNPLTDERIRLLDGIGFVWDLQASDWFNRFDQLVHFQNTHGNVDVPQKYPQNQSLSNWIRTQRRRYLKGMMPQNRIALLNQIGFVWERQPLTTQGR